MIPNELYKRDERKGVMLIGDRSEGENLHAYFAVMFKAGNTTTPCVLAKVLKEKSKDRRKIDNCTSWTFKPEFESK